MAKRGTAQCPGGIAGEDVDLGGAVSVYIRHCRLRPLPRKPACTTVSLFGNLDLRGIPVRDIRPRTWLGLSLFSFRMGRDSNFGGLRDDGQTGGRSQV